MPLSTLRAMTVSGWPESPEAEIFMSIASANFFTKR
jgi:hypothetical protein